MALEAEAAATGSASMRPEDLLTVAEAAARIGRKRQTVYNWISKGLLRGAQGRVLLGGRTMIYWPKFAAAFIREAP